VTKWPYALVAFCYLATRPYYAGLNNPNEMVRVYATVAYVDHGSFAIDPVLRAWGPVDDKGRRDGHAYSSKAPWQSLVGIPVLSWAPSTPGRLGQPADKRRITLALRLWAATLPSLLFAWAFLAWGRRRAVELGASPRLGTAVGLSVTLGTMLYPYALTFTGHGWAAIAVGVSWLSLVGLLRRTPDQLSWKLSAVSLGCFAAIAPFAEYPAAVAALPIVAAALWSTPRRAEAAAWIGLGGILPFGLGLWAHQRMWGDPWATGYAFLDNPSYRQVHDRGFFGVDLPRAEAAFGALFSAETGLFFFSPVLLGGAVMLVRSAFPPTEDGRRHRTAAWAGLTAVTLLFLFISSHSGWRGGWTLGPRYIIAAVPILGVWCVEALAVPRLAPWIAGLGAASILATGASAALYPHLSDVYTNPIAHFVLPTYREGLAPYGLAHSLGLSGHAANLVHLLPLAGAALYVAAAGLRTPRDRTTLGLVVAGFILLVLVIPERHPVAAQVETQRLWGLWEPGPPRPTPDGPGLVHDWRRATVYTTPTADPDAVPDGPQWPRCRPPLASPCVYGPRPWQQFETKPVLVGGQSQPALTMHPVTGRRLHASFPVPDGVKRLRLFYSLTDGSVVSNNRAPVLGEVWVDDRLQERFRAVNEPGWDWLEVSLVGGSTLTVSVTVAHDGARSFVIAGRYDP
jgi:hypothetical protein